MARDDRKRWDEKHASRHGQEETSPFLRRIFESHAWHIQPGTALDIATGKGRNALFLAERGFNVEGVDISEIALQEARRRAAERNISVTFRQAELDTVELPEAAYDMILNFNFLLRPLISKIRRALKPGGHIVFETYLDDQGALGHPRNPAYLLRPNELLELFHDFRIFYYREGKFVESGEEACRAGLFAQKAR